MKTVELVVHLLVIAVAAAIPTQARAQCVPTQTAEYEVYFDATWSADTHPTEFPSNAHFSGLVGGVHNAQLSFWEEGQLASVGIERMAESGSKTSLLDEVSAAIGDGDALDTISGGGIGVSPGTVAVTIGVSLDFPLATIVTMIAPSPDWFAGVSGRSLFVDGDWLDELSVPLYPFDAGTDSGTSYTSSNQDTQPPEPISEITGFPFLNGDSVPPLGTFTFQRLDKACVDADGDSVPDTLDNCLNVYNPPQRDTDGDGIGSLCDPDLTNDCEVNFLDLGVLKASFLSTDPNADLNGDGFVNFLDIGIAKDFFLRPPGPSGTANLCARDRG